MPNTDRQFIAMLNTLHLAEKDESKIGLKPEAL